MRKFVAIVFFASFVLNLSFAEETYNLEILFKTGCPLDSMETFGHSLSSAGDVNNDGFADIIVGSKTVIWAGAQDTSPGHAYIYYGGPTMDTIVDISLPGEHPLDLFGSRVAGIGDINGDSFDDVAVGAPNCAQIDSCGRVYIYFGGSSMDSIPDMILKGTFCAAFGIGIASGDINGDGWNDIVVGEYWWNNGDGRVYIYYGGPLLDTVPDVIINGHNGESKGVSVGSGGDLNSDGYEDIVIGAFNNDEAGFWAGKVYAFFGGNPMDTIPDSWLHGEGGGQSLGWFGCDIMRVQNGYDRVITGTVFWGGYRGKVYILYGGEPMDTIPDLWMLGKTDTSVLGDWSCSAGDVDGDGYEDALAGAPNDIGIYGGGYVWLGMPLDSTEDAYLRGDIHYYAIGNVVASAGDVNGDGKDEVMFSNYTADSNETVWVCKYTGQSINEISDERHVTFIDVYPNPFNKTLNIRLRTSTKDLKIRIFDISGREVLAYDLQDKIRMFDINTENLPCGVYFVEVETSDVYQIRKVVKVE